MILDAFNEFSDAQAVTSTAISTNVIDLGSTNTTRDIGAGQVVYLIVTTQTAITDTSSDATLTVTLESDTAAALNVANVIHFTTGALSFATYSAAGSVIAAIALPIANYKRYLGLRYTVASGPFTAGAIDAFLTEDYGKYKAYVRGYTNNG
jgi:hypothetical protein